MTEEISKDMKEYWFPLMRREEIAEDTMAFRFDASGTDFTFKAGQHADFTLADPIYTDAEGSTRTFSLASSPHIRDSFIVATRMRDTAFKRTLREIPIGTELRVKGPMGSFAFPQKPDRQVAFLAGGIGITPFRSMVEWATHEKLPNKITLFYGNRTQALAAFLPDFEGWAKENGNFTLIPAVDVPGPGWRYETGRVDGTMIKKFMPDASRPIWYTAGPPAMVEAMRAVLEEIGVDPENVRSEEFGGY
ncbi:FAD-dependent oxidoreductase [Candidatus Parcubacteria bacterium]|nr:MAG: FAD-dependent oxidoreductase [Candidatus Parcubacteria bacterium]